MKYWWRSLLIVPERQITYNFIYTKGAPAFTPLSVQYTHALGSAECVEWVSIRFSTELIKHGVIKCNRFFKAVLFIHPTELLSFLLQGITVVQWSAQSSHSDWVEFKRFPSVCVFQPLPTCILVSVRLCGCHCLSFSSVIDWQSVQGVPRLLSYDSWDKLQSPSCHRT